MSANAKMRPVMRAFKQSGWRLGPPAQHWKAYCPCGEHIAVFPTTLGRGRAWANMLAQFRRLNCEYLPDEFARKG